MYFPGAERSPPLFASPDAPPACASPRSECRGVLDVLGTLRSSRGERLTAVPPCARSGSPKAEPGDPLAAASMRAPRWRLSVLAKAMRGVRWLFFFRAAGVALAWLAGTPWEPSRAGRRIFSRAFSSFFQILGLRGWTGDQAVCRAHCEWRCVRVHEKGRSSRGSPVVPLRLEYPDIGPRSMLCAGLAR